MARPHPSPVPAGAYARHLARASEHLQGAGVPSPRLDARLLLAEAAGTTPEAVIARPERPLGPAAAARFDTLVRRRAAREPVSRLLGRREFWSLPFRLSRATLDPRPDSETLVEAVLADAGGLGGRPRLLDLGTGSGCLLLALLHEMPGATGVGIDVDPEAVSAARCNAESLGLAGRARFRTADWRSPGFAAEIGGSFDRVVANPPYIPSSDIAGLAPEVSRFEPRRALDGGADGLDPLRAIAVHLARLTMPQGRVYVEVGAGQRPAAESILAAHGVRVLGVARDLSGTERCVVCAPPSAGGRAAGVRQKCFD